MKIKRLIVYRDGGTIGIITDTSPYVTYHCNPGAFRTPHCLSLESEYHNYSGPNVNIDTAKELLLALKDYTPKDDHDKVRKDSIIKVIYEIYPELKQGRKFIIK